MSGMPFTIPVEICSKICRPMSRIWGNSSANAVPMDSTIIGMDSIRVGKLWMMPSTIDPSSCVPRITIWGSMDVRVETICGTISRSIGILVVSPANSCVSICVPRVSIWGKIPARDVTSPCIAVANATSEPCTPVSNPAKAVPKFPRAGASSLRKRFLSTETDSPTELIARSRAIWFSLDSTSASLLR